MWNSNGNVVENYLETESTIRSKSLVTAEWNLNIIDNIEELGNYRYRPDSAVGDEDYEFKTLPGTFAPETELSATQKYFGATDSDIVVDGGFDNNDEPLIFTSKKKKMKSLFSLEDCLGRFRPRSGINKVLYFDNRYLNRVHPDMAQQPRFYFPTPDDKFKYWTSYRTEGKPLSLEAEVRKVYPTETVNGQYITKIKAIANSFSAGDYVSFEGIEEVIKLTTGSFLIDSASSNYIKIVSDSIIVPTTAVSVAGATALVTSTQNLVRGISYRSGSDFLIDDAVPFVVYSSAVPANRLVVKMQTKVGDIDLGPYVDVDGNEFEDPFYDKVGNRVKAVPSDWTIELLNADNEWVPAYHFDPEADAPFDIPTHGQVELSYGLNVPATTTNITNLRDIFLIAGKVASTAALPIAAPEGYAYLVTEVGGPGTFHVAYEVDGQFAGFDTFDAVYEWQVRSEEVPTNTTSFVKDFTNPDSYTQGSETIYRDFQFIKGIRLAVKSMTVEDATFDLIEMSPRLAADITDMTTKVSVTKHASDLGSSGMPVGQLLASTGSIQLFDYDQSFNKNNPNSIVAALSTKNLQIKIYESIFPGNGTVYSIPIKTLYADGFPETNNQDRSVSIKLRDLFFYFESMKAPEILIPNCSLSMAISCLMDSIGFSNYTFKRPDAETKEAIIPYFFVGPDTTVAQALQDLAVSTQTAMFLDEYNNLVLMSKEYMMPKDETVRPTDFTFIGDSSGLANILQIQSINDDIYNDGKISYESKYIQRSYSSLAQANYLDSDKTWVYKPVLLWEVSPGENTKSWNDESGKQSSYTLAAIPLSSDLTKNLPTVVNGVVVNNTMDLGEAVYWLSRYNGYFYSNGEIIRFDAVQYAIPASSFRSQVSAVNGSKVLTITDDTISKFSVGQRVYASSESTGLTLQNDTKVVSVNVAKKTVTLSSNSLETGTGYIVAEDPSNVWISSVEDYQKYFSNIPFGGKIYPTGLVRIYCEPFYDAETNTLKEGKVAKHGRGQFGTARTSHFAGLSGHWTDTDNQRIIYMSHSYMFNGGTVPATYQNVKSGVLTADRAKQIKKATTNGVIKNYLSARSMKEAESNKRDSVIPGTIQSSALVIDGPTYPSGFNPQSFVQYVYKPLEDRFAHFTTRMRIIGSMEDERSKTQTPVGNTPYYTVDGRNIGGSSGGIGIWVDPSTNCGYYFEIVALTDTEVNAYNANAQAINTMFFYKIQADASGNAIPIVLWSGLAPIICDDGRFTGQGVQANEKNPTVYDISIEIGKNSSGQHFNLYLNDRMVGTAVDKDPLKKKGNIALFVRGSSRVMFENVSAIGENYSTGSATNLNTPVSDAFGIKNQATSLASRKFAMSGAIKQTVLDGITRANEPKYNVYFEEFGTIMRECAYFNVKYDKAYPALSAKISPTFNNNQGYAVSGFTANAFGAEFLVFNTTDTVLSLDSGSGNYLRIQGVTFTQNSRHDLTVDEFFSDKGDLTDPDYRSGKVYNEKYSESYEDIKKNRLTYGKKAFTINAPYIQSQDAANDMMQWLSGKIMKPRKAVGMEVLSMPHIQLGDIVEISYNKDGIGQVSEESSGRYVIYSIEYNRDNNGPGMNIFLSEVK